MDIMLDIETMGINSNAAIVAIGAVAFDIEKRAIVSEFYTVLDLASSIAAGGVCDASTIMWWLEQSDAARLAIFSPTENRTIEEALDHFSEWYNVVDGDTVWGNGATADNVWLANAYRRLNRRPPWRYRQDRCYRTVSALHPEVERTPFGTEHNALDDAKGQALHLIAMLNPVAERHT